MPKITLKDKKPGRKTDRQTIVAKTKDGPTVLPIQSYQWWNAKDPEEKARQLISTANYLQKTQQYRIRQASIFSRIISGKPLLNYALNSKALDVSNQLPINRPTLNVTQSCLDTLVSRMIQNKPKPTFLTDGGDYKQRALSKQMNQFIQGEFYRCNSYEIGAEVLHDAGTLGDGFSKICEKDKKVYEERVLATELYVDRNDSYLGKPRQLIQLKICDRDVVAALAPKMIKKVEAAQKAYVDGSDQSSETVSDQIILVEGWHLKSGPEAEDGCHAIACSSGMLSPDDDMDWDKDYFPFVRLPYSKTNLVGYFSQGLAELLMGTQIEINKLLITMSQAINLIGVPRIFIDELSKVLETAFNNNVGTIIKYRGTKPIYEVAPCVPEEMYQHLERLIRYAYQQAGISELAAASNKPAGLNSGEAQRVYLDNQDVRFTGLERRWESYFNNKAFLMIDVAKDIKERDGEYTTTYLDKNGTKEIDFPDVKQIKDSHIIQCFDESSLPKDPAGRAAKLSEMLASGEISLQEYRRLSSFPDLEQSDKLANALEERILQTLDAIVEDGKDGVCDVFMLDPTDLATTLTVQYINLFSTQKLEEKKMQKLRDFFTSIQNTKAQAAPPQIQAAPQPQLSQGNNPNASPPPAPPPTPNSVVSQAS